MTQPKVVYGGQAVLEGVLIRGRRSLSLAVRLANGTIHQETLPFNPHQNVGLKKVPFIRGALVLWETLSMGIRAINRSGELAMIPAEPSATPEPNAKPKADKMGKGAVAGTVVIAMAAGVGFFFLLPHYGVRLLDPWIASSIASNALEGVVRLVMLVGYILLIGRLSDVKRLFSYHGAEHMAVHAFEHGDELVPANVAKYPPEHPRCGTAFLLLVAVVSVVVFSFIGRPALWLSITSRIVLIPVIAGVSYELLRMSARNEGSILMKPIILPGLLLQKLTTRQPDVPQMEVAIASLMQAVRADQGATTPGDQEER